MRFPILVLSLLLTASFCGGSRPALITGVNPPETLVVVRNVAVFAGDATTVTPAQDVWIAGDRIQSVGPTGERSIPAEARVIDGTGRTLLPGLIDLHAHVLGGAAPPWKLALPDPERTLAGYLYAGITTIVDLGGDLKETRKLRGKLENGKLPGPRMLIAGPHFTAPGGHPIAMLEIFLPWYLGWAVSDEMFGMAVGDRAAADRALQANLALGIDVVKVTSDAIPLDVPRIDGDVAAFLVEQAHAADRKVFAHIGTNEDAWRMMRAGVDIFAHNVYMERLTDATAAEMARRGIAVIPTLAVFAAVRSVAAGAYAPSAMARAMGDPAMLKSTQNRPAGYRIPPAFAGYIDHLDGAEAHWWANLETLRRHGVTILVGSDSPGIGMFAGAAMHEELRLLMAAGMPAGQVIRAATFENARALGMGSEIGSIAPGLRADLLMVKGNPLEDPAAMHAIEAVFQNGRRISRLGE